MPDLSLHGDEVDGRAAGGVPAQEAHAGDAAHALARAAQVQDAQVEAPAAFSYTNTHVF